MPTRFTTTSVPKDQRLDYWQAVCSEQIGTFRLKDYQEENFSASIDLFEIGDVKLGSFQATSQTLERTQALIKPSQPDDYIVVLGSDHTINVEHGGHRRSDKGGIFLVDIAQPYSTAYPEHLDVIDLFVPRTKLEAVLGPAHLAAGLRIDGTQSSFSTLSAFIRSLAEFGANLEPATAARMSTIAVDLIAVGFAERMQLEPSRSFGNASLLYRAKAYIDDHLDQTGLGMEEVAKATNVSVRRLHQIALDHGISLTDWIWERRLMRAHTLLADPAQRCLTVAVVAYRCGFTDPAHFSRRFKERFGLTPTECRSQPALERAR